MFRGSILAVVSALMSIALVAGSVACQSPSNGGVTINLEANNLAFNRQSITVSAGASVALVFNNRDAGVGHNFALYRDSSAQQSIFIGQIINGPNTITYNFTAPTEPGTYFFRCDPHPLQMTGSFIVQ